MNLMGMTLAEKILAAHAERESVKAGEFALARVDFALANDITAPPAIEAFEKAGVEKVFDSEKIALVADHFTPCKDVRTAALVSMMRRFAQKHGINHYYEVGAGGGVFQAQLQQPPADVSCAGGQPAGTERLGLERGIERQRLVEGCQRRAGATEQAQRLAAQRIGAGGDLTWGDGERSTLVAYSAWSEKSAVLVPR